MTPTCTERTPSPRSARRLGAIQRPSPVTRRSRSGALPASPSASAFTSAPESQPGVERDRRGGPATWTPVVRRRFSIGTTFDRHHVIPAQDGRALA